MEDFKIYLLKIEGGTGSVWHDSRTDKIEHHGSRIEKFRFPGS